MNVLSVDQATKTGFSVFKEDDLFKYGCFDLSDVTRKSYGDTYFDEKVLNVQMFLERCIGEFEIDLVVMEDIQKQQNVQTYKNLAYLQGALKLYCYSNHIPYSILKPSEWRKVLKIKGRKREEQKANSIKYVESKYGIIVSDDIADSICINDSARILLKKNKLEIFKEY